MSLAPAEKSIVLSTSRGPVAERTVRRSCPCCGVRATAEAKTVLERDGWRVVACQDCGFVHMPVGPRLDLLVDDIAWEKQFVREDERRKRAQPLLHGLETATRWRHRLLPRATPERLARKQVSRGRVVDVGCGTGTHILGFGPRFAPFGVEISKALARDAHAIMARAGGGCIQAPAIEGLRTFSDGFFDVAVLRSFLEHEWDPNGLLAEVARVLRLGGVAIVKVPNHASWNCVIMGERWCGYRVPDHVNYFTPASLRLIGERHGFTVAFPLPWSMPTDDNMWAVFTRVPATRPEPFLANPGGVL